jgi:hypothetical protein
MSERTELSGSLIPEAMAPVPAVAAVQRKSSEDSEYKEGERLRRPSPVKPDSEQELEEGNAPSIHRIDSLG